MRASSDLLTPRGRGNRVAAHTQPSGLERIQMSKRLFVGNLSFDVSETELQEAFAPYGSTAATIPTNDSGRPKGFGFVDVEDGQMDAAIAAWDGKDMKGRSVAVNEAKPRPQVQTWSTGGGDRGRGGYGGGGRGGYGGGGGGGRSGGGGGGGRW